MRKVTEDWSQKDKVMLFVKDAPEGGCIVECPCRAEFNEKGLEVCPNCGMDLVFPGWAEW